MPIDLMRCSHPRRAWSVTLSPVVGRSLARKCAAQPETELVPVWIRAWQDWFEDIGIRHLQVEDHRIS